MKPVIQQHPSGCAIASVAALAACSYEQASAAAKSLGIEASNKNLWSSTKPMRQLLQYLGFEAGPKQAFFDWASLPDCALLAIKWREVNGTAYWHWVVFYRDSESPKGAVLDSKASLKNHRRFDFGRIKPKWFITVAKPC